MATFKEQTGAKKVVTYNPEMFEPSPDGQYLRYNQKFVGELVLPIECSSCYKMFAGCYIPTGLKFGPKFNTKSVACMVDMFNGCRFPRGFEFGPYFSLEGVHPCDMTRMFKGCEIPKGLDFKKKFSSQLDYYWLAIGYERFMEQFGKTRHSVFYDPAMFTPGSAEVESRHKQATKFLRFNPRFYGEVTVPIHARSCFGMFSDIRLPKRFKFTEKFDTRDIVDMSFMFCNCVFPEGFTLGEHFETKHVKNCTRMFAGATFPPDFKLLTFQPLKKLTPKVLYELTRESRIGK